MRTIILSFILILIISVGCSKIQLEDTDPLYITIEEISFLKGDYTGTLTYLDYGSEELVNLNSTSTFTVKGNKLNVIHNVSEPNGSIVKQKANYKFKNGLLEGTALSEKEINGQSIYLVWEDNGKDNNKAATIRFILDADEEKIQLTKMVKYENSDEFFMRNEYILNKS